MTIDIGNSDRTPGGEFREADTSHVARSDEWLEVGWDIGQLEHDLDGTRRRANPPTRVLDNVGVLH
jgi:hypothetical protein